MSIKFWNKSYTPIGIDVGTHRLRAIQLAGPPQNRRVIAAASVVLPANLPSQGPQRVSGLSAILNQLLKQSPFRGREVVSCLPVTQMQYKNLRVPRMPDEELTTAVAWEARDRLQLGNKQACIQFFNAGEVRQGEELRQEVILMAADESAVLEHVDVLQNCDLIPLVIEALPCSLTRIATLTASADASASSSSPAAEDDATFVLDIGYSSTKVLIARQGRVLFFKVIEIGAGKFDQTIAQKLNLSPGDAADLRHRLQQSSFDPADQTRSTDPNQTTQAAVIEALRPILSELAAEIGLCLRYYSVTFRGRRPQRVLLAGGEAAQPLLLKVLREEAALDPVPLAPLAAMNSANLSSGLCATPFFSEWSVAVGLTLRSITTASLKGVA